MINPSESPDAERMSYGILGEDTTSIDAKLGKYTGDVDWDYLKAHFEAGVLLYVDPDLALAEVGKAFSNDESQRVDGWLKTGELTKPSEPHAVYWEKTKARFTALVVSPFVLVQPAE